MKKQFVLLAGIYVCLVFCFSCLGGDSSKQGTDAGRQVDELSKAEYGHVEIKLIGTGNTNIKLSMIKMAPFPSKRRDEVLYEGAAFDVQVGQKIRLKTGLYEIRTNESGKVGWIDKYINPVIKQGKARLTVNVRVDLTVYKEFDPGFLAPKEADGLYCKMYYKNRLVGDVQILNFDPDAKKQRLRVSGLQGDWYVGPKYTLYYKFSENDYGNGTMARNDDGSWGITFKYRTEDIPDGLDFYTDKWRCVKKFN